MRVPSRRAIVALALPLMLAVWATPASAQSAGVVVFRGIATAPGLCYPGAALVNPGCGPTGIPPDNAGTGWTISAPSAGELADFCVGAGTGGAGIETGIGVNQGTCQVNGSGSVTAALNLLGAWCGLSSGTGTGTVSVGTDSLSSGIGWIVSAGTVLPITDNTIGTADAVVGGVVDAVGAVGGGNCATAASVGFNVIGVLAGVQV